MPQGKWTVFTKKNPCPVCGHDWCTLTPGGDAVRCMRQPVGGREVADKHGTVAWMHPVPDQAVAKCIKRAAVADAPKLKHGELKIKIRQMQTAVSPKKMTSWAKNLGVTEDSLKDLCVGFDDRTGGMAFPMYDGDRRYCGIRTRYQKRGEEKWTKGSVLGSTNGLFIPQSLKLEKHAGQVLLMPEGPTDVAAALSMGMMAIGRPMNSGGGAQLKKLFHAAAVPLDAVIVADNDQPTILKDGTPYWAGLEGALQLVNQLLGACRRLRVLALSEVMRQKDLRKYYNDIANQDGNHAAFRKMVDDAPVADKNYLVKQLKCLELRKKYFRYEKESEAA